jgi:hypothetical protein
MQPLHRPAPQRWHGVTMLIPPLFRRRRPFRIAGAIEAFEASALERRHAIQAN